MSIPLTGTLDQATCKAAALRRLRELEATAPTAPSFRGAAHDARDLKLAETLRAYGADRAERWACDEPDAIQRLCDDVEGVRCNECTQLNLRKPGHDLWWLWPFLWRDLQATTSLKFIHVSLDYNRTTVEGPCMHCDGLGCPDECERLPLSRLLECLPPSLKVMTFAHDDVAVEATALNVATALYLTEESMFGPFAESRSPWENLAENTSLTYIFAEWTPTLSQFVLSREGAVESHMYCRWIQWIVHGLRDDTLHWILLSLFNDSQWDDFITALLRGSTRLFQLDVPCWLGVERATELVNTLSKHTGLTALGLDNNKLGDAGAASIAGALANVGPPATVDLSENGIGDIGVHHFCTTLQDTGKLEKLSMSSNNICDAGAIELVAFALKHSNMCELDLRDNPISVNVGLGLLRSVAAGVLTVRLPVLIEAVYQVQLSESAALSLSGPKYQLGERYGIGALHLAVALGSNTSIRVVDLTGQKIGARGMTYLCSALDRNISIQVLRLGLNGIGDLGASALGDSLARSKTIKELCLKGNDIGGWGGLALARGLAFNTTLEHVDVRDNQLGDHAVALLVKSLRHSSSIQVARLDLVEVTCAVASLESFVMADPLLALASTPIQLLAIPPIESSLQSLTLDADNATVAERRSLGPLILSFAAVQHLHVPGALADAEFMNALRHLPLLKVVVVSGCDGQSGTSGVGDCPGPQQHAPSVVWDEVAALFACMLRSSAPLVELHLPDNIMTVKGLADLGAALRLNKTLRVLNVTSGTINAAGISAFLHELGPDNHVLEQFIVASRKSSGVDVEIIGVEYLNSRNLDWDFFNIQTFRTKWPPILDVFSLNALQLRSRRDAVFRFLEAAAASSSPLVRSRLALIGRGGAGKTTLKLALLLSGNHERKTTVEDFRGCIADRIRDKWKEEDFRAWIDTDLARRPRFFDDCCKRARGITGARWLNYTIPDLIRVFGESESEMAFSVVDKMTRVLCFLNPEQAVRTSADLAEAPPPPKWEWLIDVFCEAFGRVGADFVQQPAPQNQPIVLEAVNVPQHSTVATVDNTPYAVLLDIPHVLTEGIELDRWDDAGFTLWDMPGQMEFYPMRTLFCAAKTAVYVLVIDASDGLDDCKSQLQQWLSEVRFVCRGAHSTTQICFVVSHTDNLDDVERTALRRDVLLFANKSHYGNSFTFKCFVAEYAKPGGGCSETGIDALCAELRRLRGSGPSTFAIPATYQQICDDVVAQSAKLAHWPVVKTTTLDYHNQRPRDVLLVLESLGFVQRFGHDHVVLEPVTWLSRIMGAFLHPYYGIYRTSLSTTATKDRDSHYNSAVVSSREACRIINLRTHFVDPNNERNVLALLANFDVCFEIKEDGHVFPGLLPRVTTLPIWVQSALDAMFMRGYSARRYMCILEGEVDSIDATISVQLMRRLALLTKIGLTPILFGRGTYVAACKDRKCYLGFQQSNDDHSLDIFAIGAESRHHLALVTMQFALVVSKDHKFVKRTIVRHDDEFSPDISESMLQPINHAILGKCGLCEGTPAGRYECDFPISVEDVTSVMKSVLPDWLLQSFQPMHDAARYLATCEFDAYDVSGTGVQGQSLRDDVLVFSEAWQYESDHEKQHLSFISTFEKQRLLETRALQAVIKEATAYAEPIFVREYDAICLACRDCAVEPTAPSCYKALKAACEDQLHEPCQTCQGPARIACVSQDPFARGFKSCHLEPKKIQWANSNATQWGKEGLVGAIEMAKLYCPKLGPHDDAINKTSFADLDGSAIFNMLSWCNIFPDDFLGTDGTGQRAARARNAIVHTQNQLSPEKSAAVFGELREMLRCLERHTDGTDQSVAAALELVDTYENQIAELQNRVDGDSPASENVEPT